VERREERRGGGGGDMEGEFDINVWYGSSIHCTELKRSHVKNSFFVPSR
jgi:hypothetical protein